MYCLVLVSQCGGHCDENVLILLFLRTGSTFKSILLVDDITNFMSKTAIGGDLNFFGISIYYMSTLSLHIESTDSMIYIYS